MSLLSWSQVGKTYLNVIMTCKNGIWKNLNNFCFWWFLNFFHVQRVWWWWWQSILYKSSLTFNVQCQIVKVNFQADHRLMSLVTLSNHLLIIRNLFENKSLFYDITSHQNSDSLYCCWRKYIKISCSYTFPIPLRTVTSQNTMIRTAKQRFKNSLNPFFSLSYIQTQLNGVVVSTTSFIVFRCSDKTNCHVKEN